jgi:hypothetical protein
LECVGCGGNYEVLSEGADSGGGVDCGEDYGIAVAESVRRGSYEISSVSECNRHCGCGGTAGDKVFKFLKTVAVV